jgi:predicted ATPase
MGTVYLRKEDIKFKQLTVVTGPAGTGKTEVCKRKNTLKQWWKDEVANNIPIERCLSGKPIYREQRDLWLNYILDCQDFTQLGRSSARIATHEIVERGLLGINKVTFMHPENYLHQKAQSNMGFFLAKIATSIPVVVETQSEHVINGIRIAALSDIGLKHSDIIFIYLTIDNGYVVQERIGLSKDGSLSDFPKGFLDQMQYDLNSIFKLGKKNK